MTSSLIPVDVLRYPRAVEWTTPGDPFDDLLQHVGFLEALDYVVDLLVQRHRAPKAGSRARASRIAQHARLATLYAREALAATPETGFLSAYYSMLNLLKLYVLFSPRHGELAQNRWHGASYDGFAKTSRSLATEEIILHQRGAIPLWYELVTGERIVRRRRVRLDTLYAYISSVDVEYRLATGHRNRLGALSFFISEENGEFTPWVAAQADIGVFYNEPRLFKALPGFRRDTGSSLFVAAPIAAPTWRAPEEIRQRIRAYLLYHPIDQFVWSPASTAKLLLPEELPIILMFFYMSSVVRYVPERLEQLARSRFWPMISVMRKHALHRMFTLFWSFAQQAVVMLTAQGSRSEVIAAARSEAAATGV